MKVKLFKVLALTLSAVLLVATTVFVTVAYLTSSAMVTNTFTVGEIGIHMYETAVNENGKPLDDNPVAGAMKTATSNKYKLVPNTTYTKDPTIYINSGSSLSYLFIKVRNDIFSIEETGDSAHPTIAQQLEKNGWKVLPDSYTSAHNSKIYVYTNKETGAVQPVGNNASRQDIDVFQSFTVSDEITDVQLALHTASEVKVVAYAIQVSGFEEAVDPVEAAWNAIKKTYPGEVNN